MNTRKIFCSLLALLMVFVLTGCETFDAFKAAFIDKKEEDDMEPIRIGVFEPLTGASASAAADEIAGIELAHEMYPSVMGRKIELVYADNQSDVSTCRTAIESLVSQKVKFIIGSYNSIYTLAGSDAVKEAGIPAVCASNTNPLVTATNPYYFRVCCIDSYEGQAAADYVLNKRGTTSTVIVVVEGNDYASIMATAFKESFTTALGAESYTTTEEHEYAPIITIPADAEDYYEYFAQIRALNPDIVYFPGSADEARKIISLSREMDFNFNWLGSSQWNGLALKDIFYTIDFDPAAEVSDMTKKFKEAYAQKYGAEKTPSDTAALGFDAYLLVVEAISELGPFAAGWQYVDALESISDMKGSTGNISMSESGNPIKEIIIEYSVDDSGKTIFIYSNIPQNKLREDIVISGGAVEIINTVQ